MKKLILNMMTLTLIFTSATSAYAAQTLKLAFLAPEGVTWTKSIEEMAKAIEEKTQKRVQFKFYFGGVSGDESDMLRKVRSGQLSGGMFTGKTLGDIDKDTRALEIPFTFQKNPLKALENLNSLSKEFTQSLSKKGFHALGFYEVGQVYLGSTKEVKDLESLKGLKIWVWEGDKIAESMIESLGLVSVPLALPDVLSSLSSGIIQAAYAPPLGMSALQWHSKIKYIVNYPLAYATGALVITNKEWAKISTQDQQIIQTIANEKIAAANLQTQIDNQETLNEFKNMGIKLIDFPKTDYEKSAHIRSQVVKKLSGSFFSKAITDKIEVIYKSL
jgi:TRAP-type C4-dicarboxylate transport system substrate-binding protein